mmetsp:Transcript_7513/g.20518  ORF Transcript_7513/g.20518 Transcript_7513/m.20518 type:complete len:915 (-) Transcript_7513:51-2795(-)
MVRAPASQVACSRARGGRGSCSRQLQSTGKLWSRVRTPRVERAHPLVVTARGDALRWGHRRSSLELVLVVVEGGDLLLETLALADASDERNRLLIGERVAVHGGPVVEHHLREGLSRGGLAEGAGEAEGLLHRQVGLDVVEGGARALRLLHHGAAAAVEAVVHTPDSGLRALNLNHEHGLLEAGLCSEHGRVEGAAGGGDDLTAAAVDGIGVEHDVLEVHANAAHVLLSHGALLGGPLPCSHDAVLDLVEVLHRLGGVHHDVGAGAVGAEAPELAGLLLVPAVVVDERASAVLGLHGGGDLVVLDVVAELVADGLGDEVDAVVLVGRLGHDGVVRVGGHSLAEGHHGVGDDDRCVGHEVLLEILKADLDVKLAAARHDVLARLLDGALHQRVRLGEALEALDELGEVVGVLGLHGDAHDGGDGVLHGLNGVEVGVGVLERASLDEVLVNANEGDSVAAGYSVHGLRLAAHHEEGALDVLDVEVLLLPVHVVGAHDLDLLASANGARVDAAEGIEAALVSGGHHLGDVARERTVGVAVLDGGSEGVVHGAVVEVLAAVLLRGRGRGEVGDDHLQKRLVRGQPLLHAALEEGLLAELLVILVEGHAHGGEHLVHHVVVLGHAVLEDLANGLNAELHEGAHATTFGGLGPLLGLGVEEVVAPELAHHLVLVCAELLGVHASELGESEGPAVETGGKGHGSLGGVHLHVAERLVLVGGDDDVDVLEVLLEAEEHVLAGELELEEGAVELVDGHHGPNALGERLAKHGLRLDAHALDAVHHHKRAIGHAERGRHLRREVNVPGRVNEVHEELAAHRLLGHLDVLVGYEVKGDTSGLDGDAAVLLVLAGVRQASVASSGRSNDARSRHKGVRQRGLPVVHVRDDGHVTDVVRLGLDGLQLIDSEVHHGWRWECRERGGGY